MVSLELGKEIEKDVFCLFPSVGKRKKFPMRKRTLELRALPLSHRLYGERGPLRSLYNKRPAYF